MALHGDKHVFYDRMKLVERQSIIVFTMSDIFSAVNEQRKGKSAGSDGLAVEAFIYGGPRLSVHWSIVYNLFLKHCYVPDSFVQSTLLCLLRNAKAVT